MIQEAGNQFGMETAWVGIGLFRQGSHDVASKRLFVSTVSPLTGKTVTVRRYNERGEEWLSAKKAIGH